MIKPNGVHIRPRSPCVNAGDPSYVPHPGETYIDGQARVVQGRVDMGADEVRRRIVTAMQSATHDDS